MELKKYQKEVLHDLDDFFETLKRHIRLDIAYEKFWEERGISLRANDDCLRPYDNIISGVPRVTLKIPTAGGKTFVCPSEKSFLHARMNDRIYSRSIIA